jgi:hypothetical protein
LVTGRKPGIIVYVKSGSSRLMRQFHAHSAANGIHGERVQEFPDERQEAWECLGSVEALEALTGHPAVVRWHYILNVRPPRGASGSGEVTERVARSIRRGKMHRPDRDAVEETERRAKLPADERAGLEIAEEMARASAIAE